MLTFRSCYMLMIITVTTPPLSAWAQGKRSADQVARPLPARSETREIQIDQIPNFPKTIDTKSNKDSSKSMADFIMGKLPPLQIYTGEVYFSGTGFPFVEIILFRGVASGRPGGPTISDSLQKMLGRCMSGSEITFVKCTFHNSDGSLSKPINRTVRVL
jgi:hypothetical protein